MIRTFENGEHFSKLNVEGKAYWPSCNPPFFNLPCTCFQTFFNLHRSLLLWFLSLDARSQFRKTNVIKQAQNFLNTFVPPVREVSLKVLLLFRCGTKVGSRTPTFPSPGFRTKISKTYPLGSLLSIAPSTTLPKV